MVIHISIPKVLKRYNVLLKVLIIVLLMMYLVPKIAELVLPIIKPAPQNPNDGWIEKPMRVQSVKFVAAKLSFYTDTSHTENEAVKFI